MKNYRVWWRDTNGLDAIIVHSHSYTIHEGYLFFYRSTERGGENHVVFAAGQWIFVEVVDDDK